jgi:hypothetical protein
MKRTIVRKSTRSSTKTKVAISIASAVGLAVLCYVGSALFVGKPGEAVNPGEVLAAVTNFCAAHRPLPQTVTFSQLIAQGYLRANVLEKFGASEVTVFLNANETSPQSFLMDALMPDGSHTTLMSDGSVQGFSKGSFQQVAATNRGPATPETDSGGSSARRPR